MSQPANSGNDSAPLAFPDTAIMDNDSLEVSQSAPSQRQHSQMQYTGTPGRSLGGSSYRRGSFGGQAPSLGTTPAYRGELGARTPRKVRMPTTPGTVASAEDTIDDTRDTTEMDDTLVWGTNVSVSDVEARVRRFIRGFKADQNDTYAKYNKLLQQAIEDEEIALNVDMNDVSDFDSTLYHQIVNYPKEVVPILDLQFKQVAESDMGVPADGIALIVRPYNLKDTRSIRELDPVDIDRLICVNGMVTRNSNIIPEMRVACYECEQCQAEVDAWNNRGQIEEPQNCDVCGAKFSMRLVHNRSFYNNKQLIKLQESPNDIPEGETPQSLSLFAFNELVDLCKPGDRVTVTGVFRAAPLRVNPAKRELKSVYKTHIDVVHVHREEKGRLFTMFTDAMADEPITPGGLAGDVDAQSEDGINDSQFANVDPDDQHFQMGTLLRDQMMAKEAHMKALGSDPDIYQKLVDSLAPSIWQLDDVKRGVLCQLFGGTTKSFEGGRSRGDIHVLLVGDPGVSKSQLLTYVNKIAPRGIYTSGRGSSAVGLTAYVTKDPETRDMVLESGALVLSDMGTCCIDEFDKMSESARSMLHEVMEQQTVSVAKAGIIATLNARTSILASANPIHSRYNPRLSVVENIQLPPTLMSRFDLIYLLLDQANEANDRRLARHLVSLHAANANQAQQPPIAKDVLREYIAYARAKCHPQITEEAQQELVNGYLDMRRMGTSRNVITATARQLESLIRISEALARMRLSAVVLSDDVKEAIRLMKVATMQSATDQSTGMIDMYALTTGVTTAQREARQQMADEIKKILSSKGEMTVVQLLEQLKSQSSAHIGERDVKDALKQLHGTVNWSETGRVSILA